MIKTYKYNDLTWVDVESPTHSEVVELVKDYHLNPLVGEGLATSTSRAHVEVYDNYIYLVLHIPMRINAGAEYRVSQKEIDFVIGKDFIITTKYDTIEPLHNFSKIFETNSIVDKSGMGKHAGFIFYYMMKQLYAHMVNDLENMRDALTHVETKVFNGEEKKMVRMLSNLSRELIDLKQVSRIHKEVIDTFAPVAHEFFGERFKHNIDDILKEYNKVHELALNNRELLNELRETNDALLSTKQNEIMGTLTILASITFPLSLIAEIFAMRAVEMPIIGAPFDFEIIVGIMIFTAALLFSIVRDKKWLS